VIENSNNTKSFAGQPITAGYQSHYVSTTKNGTPQKMEDFTQNQPSYDELILDQESQVVPIFMVKINNKNVSLSIQSWYREVPLQ